MLRDYYCAFNYLQKEDQIQKIVADRSRPTSCEHLLNHHM